MLADTHHPRYPLPIRVLRTLEGVDRIIHAGDFCDTESLRALQSIAPLLGVSGNQDDDEVQALLPQERYIEVAGKRLLVTHGHQGGRTAIAAARNGAVREGVDCVIFGHSHQAYQEISGGVLLFNPGSPTWARFSGQRTFGILTIGAELTAAIHQVDAD